MLHCLPAFSWGLSVLFCSFSAVPSELFSGQLPCNFHNPGKNPGIWALLSRWDSFAPILQQHRNSPHFVG